MRDRFERLRETWGAMPQVNRILLAASTLAAVVVGIGFAFWAATPEYETLVQDASAADAKGILTLLDERNVAYRVGQDGRSIKVPASRRPEMQMALAAEGLLNSGSPGYTLLDRPMFGVTEKMESQVIRRSIEGHVEQSISQLSPVSAARVIYAAGADSPFISERQEPTASVILRMKPGQELDRKQTMAVVSLVAHSFPGLTPANISVADGHGNPLWDGAASSAGDKTDERFQAERTYREALARDLKAHVERIAGPGKADVVVRASLNMDAETEKVHEVTPGVRTSRQTTEETLSGAGNIGAARRPVGMASNTAGAPNPPTYMGASIDHSSGSYTATTVNETTQPGSKTVETARAPGRVESVSVLVALDESVEPATVEAIRRQVEALVPTGTAIAPIDRQISVERVPFDTVGPAERRKEEASAAAAERTARLLSYGVPLAVMLLMLFILARSLRRPVGRELAGASPQLALAGATAGAAGAGLDLRVGGQSDDMVELPEQEGAGVVGRPVQQGERSFDIIEQAFDSNLESIVHLAQSKPETVAMLLRGWLLDDR
ncbi:MAG TPA: flagellar basal-body MS-ring/collar protein FliF [Chthonomonadales bacterium]|nr:flagellar basal-body MS-ring/collar protein FliF [Chthonomonadales bacterium]